jgi:hypothetical protein
MNNKIFVEQSPLNTQEIKSKPKNNNKIQKKLNKGGRLSIHNGGDSGGKGDDGSGGNGSVGGDSINGSSDGGGDKNGPSYRRKQSADEKPVKPIVHNKQLPPPVVYNYTYFITYLFVYVLFFFPLSSHELELFHQVLLFQTYQNLPFLHFHQPQYHKILYHYISFLPC